MARRTTMRDLARELGLSASTVSRAFSRPDMLPPATVERILAVARERNYAMDRVAQALAVGKTGNVALIVPDIANPFFPPLLRAAQSTADAAGTYCFLGDSNENAEREEELIRRIAPQVDGMLLISPRLSSEKLQEFSQDLNVVLVNRDVEGTRRVLIDTASGVELALARLTALGHRRFAYVGGPGTSWSNAQRESAARRHADANGLHLDVLTASPATYDGAASLVPDVIATRATAIVAFDDVVASALINGLAERGYDIPRDFSIVGCDDIPALNTRPSLTTIRTPSDKAGTVAMQLLLKYADTQDERHVLECEVVFRDSIAPARR